MTVQESSQQGSNYFEVLTYATAVNRIALTFNRWDFNRLHRANPIHSGIISCTYDDDLDALAVRIDQAIVSAGVLKRQHIRINKPPAS